MLRVAVFELPARWGAPDEALADLDARLSAGPATDLVVVPEMALTGYVSDSGQFDLSAFAEPLDGPTSRAVSALARRHRTHLVTPLVLAEEGAVYNAVTVTAPDGAILTTYRKHHPWFPETWATAGPEPSPVFELGGMKLSLAVCFDVHFLEHGAPAILAAADLLIFTSAWVDDEDTRIPLLRALAQRFGISIANANWGPGIVDIRGMGGSCILDARGDAIASVVRGTMRADAVVVPRST